MNQPSLESALNVKFKNPSLLDQALVHRSYLNENRIQKLESNERLEFLGDAVLETAISSHLYRLFPNLPEGELTNLRALIVCTVNLAHVATNLNLGQYIHLSRGEELHGGRSNQSILADTTEAIIGAMFLDQGWLKTNKLIINLLKPSIDQFSQKKIFKDPKSLFQEIAQSQQGITPHYQTLEESGPDHQKVFKVGVFLNDKLIAQGEGNSKQKAEEDASIKATKILNDLV